MELRTTFSDLKCKEVINICDGGRLGCPLLPHPEDRRGRDPGGSAGVSGLTDANEHCIGMKC